MLDNLLELDMETVILHPSILGPFIIHRVREILEPVPEDSWQKAADTLEGISTHCSTQS